MCRHILYLGPSITLAALVIDPPHSLLRQSWAPRDMRGGGTINVDGFGAGWYVPEGGLGAPPWRLRGVGGPPGEVLGRVMRYRRAIPIWSDENFLSLARVTASAGVLAAVRSATPGMANVESACAPLTADGWLFSLNGRVAGWPGSVAKLAERLPLTDLLTLEAPTDSALLWAFVRHRLNGGESPGQALAATVAEVSDAAPGSKLNLLLTNGSHGYATTAGHSLSVLNTAGRLIVASEPFDDNPGWSPVADRRVLSADISGYTLEEL